MSYQANKWTNRPVVRMNMGDWAIRANEGQATDSVVRMKPFAWLIRLNVSEQVEQICTIGLTSKNENTIQKSRARVARTAVSGR